MRRRLPTTFAVAVFAACQPAMNELTQEQSAAIAAEVNALHTESVNAWSRGGHHILVVTPSRRMIAQHAAHSALPTRLASNERVDGLMTNERFAEWLDAYGRAWETCDADAAVALFTPAVEYYESPFDRPFRGLEELRGYWAGATGSQRDIHFTHRVLAVVGSVGIAHWHATFTRVPSGKPVELDGVLQVDFAPDGRCVVLREWWHTAGQSQDG